MQAGSVVIICEPQVKPTLEAQAIARAHRMGQVRGVQVHRLLTPEGVDQRMVEMLDDKQRLFDEYVRRSDIANASPEAFDINGLGSPPSTGTVHESHRACASRTTWPARSRRCTRVASSTAT